MTPLSALSPIALCGECSGAVASAVVVTGGGRGCRTRTLCEAWLLPWSTLVVDGVTYTHSMWGVAALVHTGGGRGCRTHTLCEAWLRWSTLVVDRVSTTHTLCESRLQWSTLVVDGVPYTHTLCEALWGSRKSSIYMQWLIITISANC